MKSRFTVALGRRIAGCGGRAPAGFGHIMALTGMMGVPDVYRPVPDLETHHADGRPGAMMGWRGERSDDDEGPSAGAMVGIMAVLIAAVALALFLLRPRDGDLGPVESCAAALPVARSAPRSTASGCGS